MIWRKLLQRGDGFTHLSTDGLPNIPSDLRASLSTKSSFRTSREVELAADIDKLRELAVKARDTMAEANDCLAVEFRDFVSKHQAAHRELQEMTTHETIISILDALEAANARVKELELKLHMQHAAKYASDNT